ncbi:MAG TPA: rhodanese-like domain-containing protein [Acidimicrobiia bacterium]|nr:rhodanese-like domain-containing protein [Acidimicrobiia bacterium]
MSHEPVISVYIVETPGLGDRSYLATDGRLAVVVDPQRDIERVLAVADGLGVRITHVLETHMHNDYVSGGLALAGASGAVYVVAAAEEVDFDHLGVADGDEIVSGAIRIQVVATPGHTAHHVAYVVAHAETGVVAGSFTGGSLLFGKVGRTDLTGPEHTHHLTRAQWRSVRRLAGSLPDAAAVWPTHGFGSFCSGAGGSGATESTAGAERAGNNALLLDEKPFAAAFVAGLGPYPAYYRHMAPLNRSGPATMPPDLPAALRSDEVRARLAAGEWVVDLRPRDRFAEAHLPGAVNVENGTPVATYIGWIVPWGAPLTLIGPDEETLEAARIALGRIGIEPAARHVAGDWPASELGPAYPVRNFDDLAAAQGDGRRFTILDVRAADEWSDGHLPGALHIPWHDLAARVAELPSDRDIWVHCAAGFRAAIAASLLQRAGRRPVLVDDRWWRAYDAGLEVEEAA